MCRCLGAGLGLEGTGLSLQRQNQDLGAERGLRERGLGLGDEVGPLEAVLGAWGRVQVRRRCGLGGVMFGGGAGAERPGSLGNGACPVSDAAPPRCFLKVSRLEAQLLLERYPECGNLLLRPSGDGTGGASVTTRQTLNGCACATPDQGVSREGVRGGVVRRRGAAGSWDTGGLGGRSRGRGVRHP